MCSRCPANNIAPLHGISSEKNSGMRSSHRKAALLPAFSFPAQLPVSETLHAWKPTLHFELSHLLYHNIDTNTTFFPKSHVPYSFSIAVKKENGAKSGREGYGIGASAVVLLRLFFTMSNGTYFFCFRSACFPVKLDYFRFSGTLLQFRFCKICVNLRIFSLKNTVIGVACEVNGMSLLWYRSGIK